MHEIKIELTDEEHERLILAVELWLKEKVRMRMNAREFSRAKKNLNLNPTDADVYAYVHETIVKRSRYDLAISRE